MPLRFVLAAITGLHLAAASSFSQDPIRFARTPDISSDGRLVAFSYLGDIWVVETIGGVARPVTLHEAHDIYPVFSPDGHSIAFASNRHGSYDIFIAPVAGGKPTRLTRDSAIDQPVGWTPDGKEVLFVSNRSVTYPPSNSLFVVPRAGGAVRPAGVTDLKYAAMSPKGDRLAYVRGQGSWSRKGYRGSSNDDVFVVNRDGSGHKRLTEFTGQDGAPMWSPDGQTIYYVTEDGGKVANIVKVDLGAGDKAKPQPVSQHTDDSVRRARISGNGEWIVYECGTELFVTSTHSGVPRKLAIEVHADDKINVEISLTLSSGATEFALSPDEKSIAFVVRGEIFVGSLPGGKATRLSHDPGFDHGVTWAPDGKKIVFASDRTGHEDLYLLESDDTENADLAKANKFRVRPLTQTPEAESNATFSPDGRRIAFIRAGQLWTMAVDGSDPKAIVKDVQIFDYVWSPDGRSFAFARTDGSYASEIYITPSEGRATPRNVTRYATFNGDVTWSKRGNRISFIGQRRGGSGLFVLNLQKPGVASLLPSNDIDWDDIHLRVIKPAPVNAESGAISPDGERVALRASDPNNDDLWVANVDGRQATRLTIGNLRPRHITWSARTPGQLFFLDRIGAIRTLNAAAPLGLTNPADPPRLNISAKITIRRDDEFREMFAQSWRLIAENFYDSTFHGVDWKAVRGKYASAIPHVAMKEDLYSLISLMLGELNSSHLGIFGPGPPIDEPTPELGLLYDESYRGSGLQVAAVLKHGPADKRGLNIKAGEIISAIDRQPIKENDEIGVCLNGKAGESVLLELVAPGGNPLDPKAQERRVEIQAITREKQGELVYDRWVAANAERVSRLSSGTLGYIHIPSMNEDGLERFVRSLYSDNFDKDGLVIDVRNNGGGYTHDQVLNYLGGREHTHFRQRGGGEGLVVREYDRKWTKPLVVVVNNRTYSDAEVFPNALRALNLGKLVGQPTGGQVIFTYQVRLIDGSTFMLPRTGVFTNKGVNMEREAVQPDFVVEPTAEQLSRGEDPQIEKAIDVLKQDVIAWKKLRSEPAAKKDGAAPATTGNTPPGN